MSVPLITFVVVVFLDPPQNVWLDASPPNLVLHSGTTLRLVCFSSGGNPTGQLVWLKVCGGMNVFHDTYKCVLSLNNPPCLCVNYRTIKSCRLHRSRWFHSVVCHESCLSSSSPATIWPPTAATPPTKPIQFWPPKPNSGFCVCF